MSERNKKHVPHACLVKRLGFQQCAFAKGARRMLSSPRAPPPGQCWQWRRAKAQCRRFKGRAAFTRTVRVFVVTRTRRLPKRARHFRKRIAAWAISFGRFAFSLSRAGTGSVLSRWKFRSCAPFPVMKPPRFSC